MLPELKKKDRKRSLSPDRPLDPKCLYNTGSSSTHSNSWNNFRIPKVPRDNDRYKSNQSQSSWNKYNRTKSGSDYTSGKRSNTSRGKLGKPASQWQGEHNSQISSDTSWRPPFLLPRQMEINYIRQMGIGPDSRGLQAGIRGHSSFFRYQRNKSTFSAGASYRRRNKQSFKQKSNRNCQSVEVSERFLQHIVFSAQKEWGNATSNKFKASKRVSEENSFQDGYNVESTKSSAKRRLWNKSRSEGPVLPFKNFQETSKVPTFLFSKENLSIPSNVLPSYFCTKGIFESDVSCSSLPEKARYAHVSVSRQLVISESGQREFLCRSENISQPPFSAGFYSEQSKIISHTLSKFRIHRGSFQNEKGTSLPNSGKNFKAKKSSSRSSSGFGHSKRLLDFPGNDCIMLGLNSECKVIHETSPASFTSELESCQNAFKPKGCSDSIASSSCEMVVTGSEHSEGKICCSEALFDHCNHRCKWYMGLGWSHEFPYRARSVVSHTEIIAYQCFGNEGSNFDSPALSSCSQRPKCLDSVGQFYSLPIHQSPGGYLVIGSVPSGVDLWHLALDNNIFLRAAHIMGKMNILADTLSRQIVRDTEWSLNKTVVSKIFSLWGYPLIDLFATKDNKQTPLFCS